MCESEERGERAQPARPITGILYCSPFSLSSISAMVEIATRRCDVCDVYGPTEVIHGTDLCFVRWISGVGSCQYAVRSRPGHPLDGACVELSGRAPAGSPAL